MAKGFTWRWFLKILKKIIPVLVEGGVMDKASVPPKQGFLSAPVVYVKPASMVPGTSTLHPNTLVTVGTGEKNSLGKWGAVLFILAGALPGIGAASGLFHIDIKNPLWISLMAILGGLTGYGIRSAQPPTIEPAPDLKFLEKT